VGGIIVVVIQFIPTLLPRQTKIQDKLCDLFVCMN